MHEQSVHPQVEEHPERHEPLDIDTRALSRFGIVAAIAGILIPFALLLVLRFYERTATRPHDDRVDSQVRPSAPTPPEPRLQGVPGLHDPVPRADMEKLRREHEQRLTTYGPTNDPNFVRIPIDRAMQILADRQMKPTTQPSR
jgi:hypothetical protein